MWVVHWGLPFRWHLVNRWAFSLCFSCKSPWTVKQLHWTSLNTFSWLSYAILKIKRYIEVFMFINTNERVHWNFRFWYYFRNIFYARNLIMLRVVEACDIGCGNTKNIYRFLTDFSFRYIGIKLTLAKEDFISWKLPPTILLIFMAILKIILVSASEFFPRPHSSSQITMQCFRTLQYKKHICYIKTMIVFSFLLVSQQHED